MINNTFILLLKNLVLLLASLKFEQIVKRNENGRLTLSELEKAINEYPGKITIPPDSAYGNTYVYDVYNRKSEARKIEFDLWYDDEESDLTLSADIHKNDDGKYIIMIDDIHVL